MLGKVLSTHYIFRARVKYRQKRHLSTTLHESSEVFCMCFIIFRHKIGNFKCGMKLLHIIFVL